VAYRLVDLLLGPVLDGGEAGPIRMLPQELGIGLERRLAAGLQQLAPACIETELPVA
jgi:hypothetical protein